ncbi:hypothetical protein CI109_100496 [Kwoniella shandongensis]|uniref:Nuclear pore complex protein Nup85 n=1 Tax=Kwoniella shandongensis TaxID=1734106 RepID=A0A5M6C7F4_9TREE|nr:uncharacterized protein CI109_001661 [Kwoniella shandongensis]KAA5529722.1 hypothetical protein CI109_001661 [Kwoniella shandongensis]
MAPAPTGFSFAPPAAGSPFSFAPQNNTTSQPSSSRPPAFSFGSSSASGTTKTPAQPAHTSDDMDEDNDREMDDDDDVDVSYLQPAAYPRGGRGKWKASGRTTSAAVCPVGGEVATWVTKKPSSDPNQPPTLSKSDLTLPDRTLYFSSQHVLPDPLVSLYTESHLLFTSLQNIVAESLPQRRLTSGDNRITETWDRRGNLVDAQSLLGPPDAETIVHMRRLIDLYLDNLNDLRSNQEVEPVLKSRFNASYNIMNLAEILYFPTDGKGEGFVGEELLDWVNDVDPAPDNSQGNDIMATKNPWDHPSFWPYISRCILRGFHLPVASFLRSLANHPHPPVSKLATILAQHLAVFPRSSEERWRVDLEFLQAHKLWLAKFRAELTSFTGGKSRGSWFGEAKWASLEGDFRTVIELMEGKPNRVLEEAADWREALGAWGILVDVDMRRDHLPEIMSIILDKIPVDTTLLEDAVQSALCSADIVKALMGCYDLDVWLAAHLGDLLDKLELIPDDEERFETPLRDYFLLEYTEILQNNPKYSAFWRVVCDYLNFAGPEGRNRLRSHVVHVSIPVSKDVKGKNKETENTGDGMDVEAEQDQDEGMGIYYEIRAACEEFRLEEEFKMISQILAARLTKKGDYGVAAILCAEAADGYALSRIAEKILDSYISHGGEEFLRLVETLPPKLMSEAPTALAALQSEPTTGLTSDLLFQSAGSVFASRLTFLSQFRDYLLFMQEGARELAAARLITLLTSGIAPVGFWAVLLVESIALLEDSDILFTSLETVELLRVLQDVIANASFAPDEYLGQLVSYIQRLTNETDEKEQRKNGAQKGLGPEDALRKIEEVRLALGRNLARAVVVAFDSPF